MDHRKLGRTGLKVSPLCLGAMMFGDQTTEEDALRIVDSARQAGVNFIDTANVYASGRSEEIVGRAVRSDRDRWVIATKVGSPFANAVPPEPNLSRKYMMKAVDDSLRRLGTDYIDLYYLHREDADTPLEESVDTLRDLLRAGKIRYFGISNFLGWRIAEVVRLCDAAGIERPAALQPQYNAMNRMAEAEMIPACRHYGIGVVPYSPLARGVLTAKYASVDAPAPGTRAARRDRRLMQTEFRAESIELARRIHVHAVARNSTAAHFALNWVLNNDAVSSVIAGPRTMEQWDDYLAALNDPFTPEDEALIDTLVAPGHPSTPGFTDPQYPVTGRRPRGSARA